LLHNNSGLSVVQNPHLSESYSLLASVNHHGTQADSGHYTADVLNPVSQKWTSFNDSRVRTILEKTVKGRKKVCYLLFYMRKEYGTQLISAYEANCAKKQL
jgi:ubiquitin C-terminal hydrolase